MHRAAESARVRQGHHLCRESGAGAERRHRHLHRVPHPDGAQQARRAQNQVRTVLTHV